MSLQSQIDDIKRELNEAVEVNSLTENTELPIGSKVVVSNPTTNAFETIPSEVFRDEVFEGKLNTGDYNLNAYDLQNANNFKYVYPSWWLGLKIPYSVVNGKSKYYYDCEDNWKTHILTETPYYLAPDGNDSNDGLTPSTPKAKVSTLLTAGAKLIYMLPGVYFRDTFYGNDTDLGGDDVAIIGLGNVYITKAQSGLTWTLHSGNCYKASRTSVRGVVDMGILGDDGYFEDYAEVASVSNVIATAGSWRQSGTQIFVHRLDGSIPDENLLISLELQNSILSDSGSVFLKNLEFIKYDVSISGITSSTTLKIYLKNIRVPYGREGERDTTESYDSIDLRNSNLMVTQDCIVRNSNRDGINGTNDVGLLNPKSLEVRNVVTNPSFRDGNSNNQCTTVHNAIKVLRIDCSYYGGELTTIADVNAGTQTILLGCEVNAFASYTDYPLWLCDADVYNCKIYRRGTIRERDSINGVSIRRSYVHPNIVTDGTVTITNGVES